MITTKPAVASTWLLGLGSKLYLSNVPCMFNKHLTQFIKRLPQVCQNLASKIKALPAGWVMIHWNPNITNL